MPKLLLHAFSTFETGGLQVRFAALANHFGRRYRHAIIAMDGNLACRERLDPALDVTFPAISIVKGDTWGNARRFHRVLREMRPDTLLTSNWGTIEWAIANRLGTVRHVHVEDGFGPDERDRQIPRRVWMRRVFLAGREVVVPSLTLRRIAVEQWRLRRVRYVPNGIDLARFGADPARNDPPVIGTVAALRAEKNLSRLLRGFALGGAGARLVIAGDGAERPKLKALAAELGIADRTTFAGHMPDPVPLFRGLDAFVLSSDTEQMPISLLEAMAAGLPVAATAVGDVAAMLAPEQAPYVVPRDDAALGGAIRRLLDDAGLRAALGAANRRKAEAEYSDTAMFAAWAAVWDG